MNGGMNGFPRRSSQSPGTSTAPSMRGGGRPSPPNSFPNGHPNGHTNGQGPAMANGHRRPSPSDGVRQPVPRYPPGHGNAVAPQQVEQHVGVSALSSHQRERSCLV